MDEKWDITPKSSGRWSKLYASINPEGEIRICRRSHELLGSPEFVLLLYNPREKTIGIHAAGPDTANAFRNGRRGRHGGREIRAHQLLQRHRIELPYAIRFVMPDLDEERILNLDLRKTIPTKVSDRKSDMPF
ncbi:MAG: hypothetical protein IPM59_12720 [Chloracidobacterium sp.]|nr:hypothetical protein [Chloracidobacterium sp.]